MLSMLALFIKKEVLIAFRGVDQLLVGLFLSFIIALMTAMGVSSVFLSPADVKRLVPSLIWVLILVSAAINQERNYDSELRHRGIEAICLSGVSLTPLYLAKVLVSFIQMIFTCLVVLFTFQALLGVELFEHLLSLMVVLCPGLLGVSALCVLLGAATHTSQSRGLLFPTLLLPLILPLFFATSELTSVILFPHLEVSCYAWGALLGACVTIYFAGGMMLFEEAVKG
jgi:heme exporter protein CcmB